MGVLAWLRRRTAEYWRQLATMVFAVIAGLKAIQSLRTQQWTWWQTVLAAVVIFLAVASYSQAWKEEKRRAPLLVATTDKMAAANRVWLGQQGYVCILTRDGSWFLDGESSRMLDDKARTGNLTIFAALVTPQIRRLGEIGATVVDYSSLGWVPRVRFSVLRWQAFDATALIYRQRHGLIEVFERTLSDYPDYWLACDIMELLQRSASNGLLPRVVAPDADSTQN